MRHHGKFFIQGYYRSLMILHRFMVSYLCLTYLSTRPCIYCTILLLILFASSCHWSDKCFFDLNANWFEPRHYSSPLPNPLPRSTGWSGKQLSEGQGDALLLVNAFNGTATTLAGLAVEALGRKIQPKPEWAGIGFSWLRNLLGVREWRVPCLDILIRL